MKPRMMWAAAVVMVTVISYPSFAQSSDTGSSWLKSNSTQVEVKDVTWKDARRASREVPARIYYSSQETTAVPLILFSHGLGGSRSAAEYLGRYLASHGYISVHLEHRGSDTGIFAEPGKDVRDTARAAVSNVRNATDRAKDVSFAIDQVGELNESDPTLKGRIDMKRIGMAGHSFGAHTTMLCVGQEMPAIATGGVSLVEPRIKAAVPMSAPAPKRVQQLDEIYSNVKVPVMHMTGTLDDSPIGDTSAEQRRVPYDHTAASKQYLITFEGGDHMIFGGRRINGARESADARFHELINASTTAFFDAYVKGDTSATTWLNDENGLRKYLADEAKLERK